MNTQTSQNEELSGVEANNSILAGINLIKKISSSILGPKGSLKLLTHPGGKISISNDGATVLSNLLVDHPVSKMLINASTSQDWEEGDGTTSVALLASILAEKAKLKILGDVASTNSLIKKRSNLNLSIKPIDIIKGYEKACLKCLDLLEKYSIKITNKDFENLALTTLNSKITGIDSVKFAKICVEAVRRISCKCGSFEKNEKLYGREDENYISLGKKIEELELGSPSIKSVCNCEFTEDIDLSMINIVKKIGPISKSFLCPGLLLETKVTAPYKSHPKILVANTNLDNVKVKLALTKVEASSIDDMVKIEEKEIKRIKDKVDRISSQNFDVLINRQIIYDLPMRRFEEKDILVIENVGFDSVERVSKLTNTLTLSTFGEEHESVYNENFKFGECHEIESIKIGNSKYVRLLSCPTDCPKLIDSNKHQKSNNAQDSCSIVLFSSTESGLEELERSIHDALCVISNSLKHKRMIYGGGNFEVFMANELQKIAFEVEEGEGIGIKLFSESLLEIPKVLVTNAGGNGDNAVERLINLRKKYHTYGVKLVENYESNSTLNTDDFIGCMKTLNVLESVSVKQRVISSATECAQMLIKCDTLIKSRARKRDRE